MIDRLITIIEFARVYACRLRQQLRSWWRAHVIDDDPCPDEDWWGIL